MWWGCGLISFIWPQECLGGWSWRNIQSLLWPLSWTPYNSILSFSIILSLSLFYHSIWSPSSYLPSLLPIISFHTAARPYSTPIVLLSLFHSTHCLVLPLLLLSTPRTALLLPHLLLHTNPHWFPCSIPSYTALAIVLYSTSISDRLLFPIVYKLRYLVLYLHSDLSVQFIDLLASALLALLALHLRSSLCSYLPPLSAPKCLPSWQPPARAVSRWLPLSM